MQWPAGHCMNSRHQSCMIEINLPKWKAGDVVFDEMKCMVRDAWGDAPYEWMTENWWWDTVQHVHYVSANDWYFLGKIKSLLDCCFGFFGSFFFCNTPCSQRCCCGHIHHTSLQWEHSETWNGPQFDRNGCYWSSVVRGLLCGIVMYALCAFLRALSVSVCGVEKNNATRTQRNATITQRNATITPRNATITQHNATITQRNATITQRNATITQRITQDTIDGCVHYLAGTVTFYSWKM
jgi:hypothetical protein